MRTLALLLCLSLAPGAGASPKVLAQAKDELAKNHLVDVLTLLRPDEGNLAKGEEAAAARLLGDALGKAVEQKRPELALQIAEASFALDAGQPKVLALLGQWSLDDGRVAQARRYGELWAGVARSDPAAQAFKEKAKAAVPPPEPGSFAASLKQLFGFGGASGAGASKGTVTLYTTSWCPACKRAKAWLHGKRVVYVEKDVEKEPAAREELAAEAAKQGVGQRGVPVLNAYGKLSEGFSEQAYTRLLKLEE